MLITRSDLIANDLKQLHNTHKYLEKTVKHVCWINNMVITHVNNSYPKSLSEYIYPNLPYLNKYNQMRTEFQTDGQSWVNKQDHMLFTYDCWKLSCCVLHVCGHIKAWTMRYLPTNYRYLIYIWRRYFPILVDCLQCSTIEFSCFTSIAEESYCVSSQSLHMVILSNIWTRKI